MRSPLQPQPCLASGEIPFHVKEVCFRALPRLRPAAVPGTVRAEPRSLTGAGILRGTPELALNCQGLYLIHVALVLFPFYD